VGRGKKIQETPVKQWANKKNIPVYQPEKPMEIATEDFWKEAEVGIVIAYGKLFSQTFLDSVPELWNLHFSLLPKFRGASPVPAAILAGEKVSGVTVFQIQKGMDDGPILGQKQKSIEGDRSDVVFTKMTTLGKILLVEILENKNRTQTNQKHEEASFCGKIEKQDGTLNPLEISAEMALRKINAYYPWPGTSTDFKGKRLKILSAKKTEKKGKSGEFFAEKNALYLGFLDGSLELEEVQMEGKKAMTGADFARGYQV
jgi:methionyl-tRNA formyltransferase